LGTGSGVAFGGGKRVWLQVRMMMTIGIEVA
jgi:hypothetical protein